LEQALEHLATMNVKLQRKFIGRAEQRIAFISDPDGNSIELMQIPPESPIFRDDMSLLKDLRLDVEARVK